LAKKFKVPLSAPAGLNQSLIMPGVLPPELSVRMNKGGTITPLGPQIKIIMVHDLHRQAMNIRSCVSLFPCTMEPYPS